MHAHGHNMNIYNEQQKGMLCKPMRMPVNISGGYRAGVLRYLRFPRYVKDEL